jgi:alkylation response protein AidB-like acyl-CoA dehydrogenase
VLSDSDDFRVTVRRFAQVDVPGEVSPSFSLRRWEGLGELGVLGLDTESGGGGAIEIASAMEELGAAGFVGPLVETFIATHVVSSADADRLAEGGIASITWDQSVVPWGRRANVVLFVDDKSECWSCTTSSLEPISTLGRDEWCRGKIELIANLGPQERAIAIGEIAVSGYVLGAATRILDLASSYARERRQFGKAIGEFQAVSHPLANCFAHLASARNLLASCVGRLDDGDFSEGCQTAAARTRLLAGQSAQAAVQTALQVHGGMGFVEGTILSHLARRVRHVSLLGRPLRSSSRSAFSSIDQKVGLYGSA